MAIKNPCYQCKERILNCHSSCELYKEFKVEVDKKRKFLNDWQQADSDSIFRLKRINVYNKRRK